MRTFPQRCPLAAIYLTWAALLGGAAYWIAAGPAWMAGVWVVALVAGVWTYLRVFPRLSRLLGYGPVDDRPPSEAPGAPTGTDAGARTVTLYTALGCPFCPIVEARLERLRDRMGFELEVVDVTAKPELLRRKAIRSVPVIEVGDRRLRRNATSAELVAHITGAGAEAGSNLSAG